MTDYFVDTNIFLRYLTNDVPDQAESVERLLEKAEDGILNLHTSILSIAEIVWTLESYYGLDKQEACDRVVSILNTPGLNVENSGIIARAMLLYVDGNIDFIDAYNGLWLQEQGISSAVTFDKKHFQRISGLSIYTPDEFKK
jgi:predicted nucleic-acid-binding protein